ncbi:MerR family transcriptional regulator [Paenibacillus sp. FSL M8-0334]|uniref:MerR family transcriptional regulator n=1 Tax=Paenibacillus sp. FSL M8-0334 TaxID=2921623 RepID=UPI0030F64051
MMRIQEVCAALGLTKKAVEYYIQQELLSPKALDNGYRQFSKQDIERLRKISVLRKLGLTIKEIKQTLADHGDAMLQQKLMHNEQRLMHEHMRHSLLAELSADGDWLKIESKLRALEQQETLSSKLLNAFPGEYGRFIAVHFAHFLPDAIESSDQQEAFEEIISFLDDTATLSYPAQGQSTLDDQEAGLEDDQQAMLTLSHWHQLSADMIEHVRQAEHFLEEHEESIKAYLAFKQSEQYLTSPAFQLHKRLREFQQASGYYERFIPAMKRLSPAYREYTEKLEQASDALRAKYGDRR